MIALVLALEERDRLDERERRRVDREARNRISEQRGLGLLRGWLTRAPSTSLMARIERVRSSLFVLGWLLGAVGLFLGWAAASALLSIEVHEGRINIVLLLVLLILIPVLTLLGSLVAWLWSLRRRVGTHSLGEVIRSATLGRLVLRVLTPQVRQDVEVVLGQWTAHHRLYGRVARGQLLRWSQTVGLGFSVGALAATLAFVAFTDLAFGWSTTLDIAAADVHHWIRIMSMPWATLWPTASPSLELVESTRFFRVAAGDRFHLIDPILYGGWWPFLVMALSFYCVLPRFIAWVAIGQWHARETGRAMGLTQGVDRLLDRLTTPIVEGQAISREDETRRADSRLVRAVVLDDWIARSSESALTVIRWAEALGDSEIAAVIGRAATRILDAGGSRSLDHDAEVASQVALAGGVIGLLVRGYEPPVLDVLDFLSTVRSKVGPDREICVLLWGAEEAAANTWQRKLAGLGDSNLLVSRWGADRG